MKINAIIIFLFAFLGESRAQDSTHISSTNSKELKIQADSMLQFLLKKDYQSFLNYTYPHIIKLSGGKAQMTKMLIQQMNEMQSQGIDFVNAVIGNPSIIIDTANELQCTIPQTITMKVPKGKLQSTGILIGISKDGGKKWYFIDGNKGYEETKQLVPTLSSKLIFPKKNEPLFYPE